MKRIFLLFTAFAMAAGISSAQDIEASSAESLNKAIELANSGQEAFGMEEYDLALEAFRSSLTIAEGLGDEGADHANTCKTAICNIILQQARNLIKADNLDEALAKLNEAITTAEGYGSTDVIEDANKLIPQIYMQKGNNAYKVKDMANAIAAYQKVLEFDPENGNVQLLLGRAYAASGKINEAIAAYESAMAMGEENTAKKQLSTLFLKQAQSSLKSKGYQDAIDNAMKANSYIENANAYKIAASAAQRMNSNAQCIEFYEKYLEMKPNASDAPGVLFTIAALYQKAGNKAKAKEYYTKVASDPKYGTSAKEQLKTL